MKICKKCGSTEFYESGDCKICARERAKKRRLEKPEAIAKWNEENKDLCKELKRIWRENNKDHVVEYAKKYHIERYSTDEEFRENAIKRSKEWIEQNYEKSQETKKKYYLENTEKIINKVKEYYKKNPEKGKERTRKWREENPEQYRETHAKYRALHPEIHRLSSHKRRLRKAGGKITKGLVNRLLILQKGKCPCCGKPLGDDYQLDHIIPLALGGKNEDSNIQLMRAKCNRKKHAKDPIDYMQSIGFLL